MSAPARLRVDPADPAFIEDPYPTFARLHRESPVHYLEEDDVWLVTRYSHVSEVLRELRLYSSEQGMGALMGINGRPIRLGRPAQPDDVTPAELYGMAPGMRVLIASDPPDHTRLRRLVAKPFSVTAIRAMEPRLRAICEDLVDEMIRAGADGRADLVEHLAYPFPVIVIAELLGIPPERRDDFKRWSDDMVGGISGGLDSAAVATTALEMFEFFGEVVTDRARNPRGDLISTLVTGTEPLELPELVAFCLLLLIAGNETTTNLISNGANVLLAERDTLRVLQAHPELIPSAVEETLRFDAPVQALFRATTAPTTLADVALPEGARIMVAFGAANRDEDHYERADEFLVERNPTDHMGFGAGIHLCLGAHLARLEARIAAETLLSKLAHVELRDTPTRVDSTLLRGFARMPISLEAR